MEAQSVDQPINNAESRLVDGEGRAVMVAGAKPDLRDGTDLRDGVSSKSFR